MQTQALGIELLGQQAGSHARRAARKHDRRQAISTPACESAVVDVGPRVWRSQLHRCDLRV
eukprot:3573191-Pyramimonas_sp.AAC.1